VSPHLFKFCDDIIDGCGADEVSLKVHIIPLHCARMHELGDGLFVKDEGWDAHMRRLQFSGGLGTFVEISRNLFNSDGW
jgi:hypothetical protein